MNEKSGKIVLSVLALAGAAVMGYLMYLHYSPGGESSFCNFGEGLSCEAVNKSVYSEIFGVPMSVLGFLYFTGVFWVSFLGYSRERLRKLIFITIAFLGPSFYLTAVEIFVLKEICVFCEFSKVLMVAAIIISLALIKPDKLRLKFAVGAAGLALALTGATYIFHQGSFFKDYAEFAGCLYDKGFVVYGFENCPLCDEQREVFGDGFKFVNEVICDSSSEAADLKVCDDARAKGAPLWVQRDADGNEIFRFPAGVVSLENLSSQSGCVLPE